MNNLAARMRVLEKQHSKPRDDAMPEPMRVIISGAPDAVRHAMAHGPINGQLSCRLSRLCSAADILRHMTQSSVDTLTIELDKSLAHNEEGAPLVFVRTKTLRSTATVTWRPTWAWLHRPP